MFVTSTSPAVNPRLAKEVKTALQAGYLPTVVYCKLGIWADAHSRQWIKENHLVNYELDVTRRNKIDWIGSFLISKILTQVGRWIPLPLWAQSMVVDKRSWVLKRFLKKHKGEYQLLVAHNMGALYPSYAWAQQHQVPFAFDVEDYHPGEKAIANIPLLRRYNETLLRELLPQAAYVSYASPLIKEKTLAFLSPHVDTTHHFVVINSFPQTEFLLPKLGAGKVKLVWFSQNIAEGRGLELFIRELYRFKDQVEVHLIGNLYSNFYDGFLYQYSSILTFYPPQSQLQLNQKLAEFDIGLAIELSSADENRDICWTNKIFAYAQAGLYILATDTSGQQLFMAEYPSRGLLCAQSSESIQQNIENILRHIVLIRQTAPDRYQMAQALAWEIEQKKLIQVWDMVKSSKCST